MIAIVHSIYSKSVHAPDAHAGLMDNESERYCMLYTYTILQPKVVIFLEICCVKIDQLDYAIFSIYSKAINGTKWQNFERLTVANSMILFSETPKVSGMLKALKKIPQLYILGKRTVC